MKGCIIVSAAIGLGIYIGRLQITRDVYKLQLDMDGEYRKARSDKKGSRDKTYQNFIDNFFRTE